MKSTTDAKRGAGALITLACGLAIVAAGCWEGPSTTDQRTQLMPNETNIKVVKVSQSDNKDNQDAKDAQPEKITKTEAEWRAKLTPEQYHVTREKGTERAYTGKYWDHKEDGVYKCIGCGTPLFDSVTKFEAECGWPSFFQPIGESDIQEELDTTHNMIRTEVVCRKCDAHLGHVFNDGPKPTGLRYCINSASLNFEKRDAKPKTGAEPKPEVAQ